MTEMMLPESSAPVTSEGEGPSIGQLVARYAALFRKYFWIALLTGALGGGAAWGWVRQQPKIYESRSKLLFLQSAQNIFGKDIERVELLTPGGRWQFEEFWNTQREVMQSREFAERVVRRGGLLAREGFVPTSDAEGKPLSEEERIKRAAAKVRSMVTVGQQPNSRVAIFTVRTTDPKIAQIVASEYAHAYVDYTREFQSGGLSQLIQWFDGYVGSKRKELNEAQRALIDFKKDRGILSVSYESRQSVTGATMDALIQQLNVVRMELLAEESLLTQIREMERRGEDLRAIGQLLDSAAMTSAIQREALLTERLAQLKGLGHLEKNRDVAASQAELDAVRKNIADEIARTKAAVRNKVETLKRREVQLKRELDRIKAEALELDTLGVEYSQLRDNAENLKKLYESVLGRSEELDINSMYESKIVQLFEDAEVPGAPVSPNVPLVILIGLGVGLALGVAMIISIDLLDNTVRSEEHVLRHTSRPILAMLPKVDEEVFKEIPTAAASLDRIVHIAPRSSFAEGIKTLRTNLMFIAPDNPPRMLLVTSPGPGEGKTMCSSNMAIALAQSGLRTLIVDTDLRRPRVHKAMSCPNKVGLVNVIVDEVGLDEAIQPTEIENLFVLPCGSAPPNPAELLHTARFRQIVRDLEGKFDRVIFDSPPLGAVSDALVLGHMVDAVVLILKFGQTRRELLRRSIEQLETVGAPFMGCVLNDIDASNSGYGYSYYYYYRYDGDSDSAPERKKAKKAKSGSPDALAG
jgi:capsular exopolysaccharide synthesis family protein